MQKYELPLVLKPLFPEDVKGKTIPALEALAKKFGGKFTVSDDWGKKHLAYQLKSSEKTLYEEGYYLICKLEISPDQLAKFSRALKLMSDVLRFIVVREDQI